MIFIYTKDKDRFQIFIVYVILALILIGTIVSMLFKHSKEIELFEQKVYELAEKIDRISEENKNLKESSEALQLEVGELKEQVTILEEENEELSTENKRLEQELVKNKKMLKAQTPKPQATRSSLGRTETFKATAYDLTFESCGKKPSHPAYGKTASGFSLVGKNINGRYIAVDPTVIKLGSKVHVEFFEPYTHLTGSYTAVDTGGAIKGRKIDVYFGELDVADQVKKFGRRDVKVTY